MGSAPEYLQLIAASVALLAVVTALYTLAARERKIPYITTSIYPIFYVTLAVIALALAGRLFPSTREPALRVAACALLALGVYVFVMVARLHLVLTTLRHDQLLKNIWPVPQLRSWKRRLRGRQYEYNPAPLQDNLLIRLDPILGLEPGHLGRLYDHFGTEDDRRTSISVLLHGGTVRVTENVVARLAVEFLRSKAYVQYATCIRHPAEFVLHLKGLLKHEWKELATRVVVVDGYTPHFGFTDSTHFHWHDWLRNEGIDLLLSSPSYAGVHTATAQAFNVVKKKDVAAVRAPAMVIYEGCSALVDLESAEQCRVFYRHVLPSERMWGGMLTVIADTPFDASLLTLLTNQADVPIDLTNNSPVRGGTASSASQAIDAAR